MNEPPFPLGLMLQVTPLLPASFVTVAVKVVSVWPTVSPPLLGETDTLIVEAGPIVRVKFTLLVWTGLPESVALNVSGVLVTVAVGVPVIAPVEALRLKPAGKVPLVKVQV